MKHSRFFLFLLALLLSITAMARPVRHAVYTLVQPDGSIFHARFHGDEFMRVKTDMQGRAIIQDDAGWWCYASYHDDGTKVCSGFKVGSQAPVSVLSESSDIPYRQLSRLAAVKRSSVMEDEVPLMRRLRTGAVHSTKSDEQEVIVKHGIVILAQFANLKFKHTREDFERLLSSEGYSRDGAAGSAKEYFDMQFRGDVRFEFAVSEIVTLSRNLDYYGGNVSSTDRAESDRNPEDMIIEACRLVDDDVDFSLYDDDGNGEVDNVFVFFAGGDEAEGAGDDCIWSHAWYLRDGAGRNVSLDGKIINRYACTAEMARYQTPDGEIRQRLAGIGTFCHEYSHTFGLPDMYDTDYEGSGGESEALWGCTSMMDSGNQNNGGTTPPYFNAIEREILGISVPELIETDGVYRLEPINESGRCYKIETDVEGEYYLLECRAAKGWDAHIGGSGLLVYHIDKADRPAGYSDSYHKETTAALRWSLYNEVNCRPDHQCADLLEAIPGATNVRNVFFPLEGAEAIDHTRLTFWNGSAANMSLTGIRHDGDDIIFNVIGGSADTTPPDPVSISFEKFQDAAIVSFESSRIHTGDAYVSWGQTGHPAETVTLAPYADGKYALVLDGLVPRTSYTVSIQFKTGALSGKAGTISFMTSSEAGGYPYIYLKNVERNQNGSFPKDSRIPLRMYNAVGAEKIEWTFGGSPVMIGPDGYYRLEKSGTLKAVVHWEDGSRDIVVKEVKVEE